MADEPWTPPRVEAELRRALVTLRRLPSKNLVPAGIRIVWPDMVRDWSAYGWDKAARPRLQASASDIRDMDRALGWVWDFLSQREAEKAGLVSDVGNIVLMRSAHLTWERIGEWRLQRWVVATGSAIPGGNSIPSLRKAYRAGIAQIVVRLGGTAEPQMPRVDADERWDVMVEVAARGEQLDEGSQGEPVVARARWGLVRRR